MKVINCILILLIALCHQSVAQDKIDGKAHKQFQEKLDEQKESYSKLASLLLSEAFLGEIEFFEGLPHQSWDKGLLETELKKGISFKSHDFPFYKKKCQPSDADRTALARLLKSRNSYRKYSGPKFCGGYHPDFMVRFKGLTETVIIQLCFGCHEARIFTKHAIVYCDLASENYILLQAILEDHYFQRPDKKKHIAKLVEYIQRTDMSSYLLSKEKDKKWLFALYMVIEDGLVEIQFSDETNTEKVHFQWQKESSKWFIVKRKTTGDLKPDLTKDSEKLKILIR